MRISDQVEQLLEIWFAYLSKDWVKNSEKIQDSQFQIWLLDMLSKKLELNVKYFNCLIN